MEVAAGVLELVVDADTVTVTELAGVLVKGGVLGGAVANAPDPWSATVKAGWEFRVIRDAWERAARLLQVCLRLPSQRPGIVGTSKC